MPQHLPKGLLHLFWTLTKVKWLKEANRIKNQFMELRNHKYEMIIGFAEIEQKYIVFLRHIFGNDMILQRNI